MRSRFLQAARSLVFAVGLAAVVWFLLAPTGAEPAAGDARLAPALAPPAPFVRDTQPGDRERFMQAARTAWAYVEREYQPATGLVNSVTGYPYATVWDIASGLAALYCANELGLLPAEEYDRRMARALRTLRELRLYDGVAFNKNYRTTSGAVAGRDDRDRGVDEERGYGWSATDIGRLLVWLHVIHRTQPQHAADAEAVARRLDFSRLVADGYLWGETVNRGGRSRRYTEGRIPYEQYAAAGYAAWGHRAEKALSVTENAIPIEVMGVPLVADRRGHEHLTSEPFVLLGLELGWPEEMRGLATRMLDVQRERWRRTGQVTIVSEDAIPRPPHYFYYYAVNLHGRWFSIATQTAGQRLEGPRWVSAKAAYAWHALLPSDYTRRAVDGVARAGHAGRGWSSGVFEQTGQPTGSENVNTAGVILEAALYRMRGRPLAVPGGAAPAASDTPRPPSP